MKYQRLAATAALVFTVLVAYNNCSKGLPENATGVVTNASNSNSLTPLSGQMRPVTIFTDENTAADVNGGKPPYAYAVLQGSASVNSSGALVPPLSAGAVVVRVTDAAGQTLDLAVYISARSSSAAGAPCALPWGGTILDGQGIVAFNTASLSCPAANTCASETRRCNNGVLSGTYTVPNGCSYRSCVYKLAAYSRVYDTVCGGNPGGAAVPAACTAAQYNTTVCIGTSSGSGDSAYPVYQSYVCKGPDETVNAVDATPGATGR